MRRARQFVFVSFVIIAVFLIPLSVGAQSSAQVADLLRQITTRIQVADVSTGNGGLCHGFVSSVRYQVAYIVTAKHCIEELTEHPLTQGTSLRELNLSVTVEYANRASGAVRYIAWSKNQDALVLVASFNDRPTSYAGLCSGCRVYRTFGVGQRLPVESVLSAGGGLPIISSGMVLSDSFGRYIVMLPSSPGTSGSPVLDLQGNLVGIVVTGAVYRGTEASWVAGVVPGSAILDLVSFAVEHYESATAQSPTPVPPNATPGLPIPPTTAPSQPNVPAPSSPMAGQFLIVPGVRIGKVQLGMPFSEVEAILGAEHAQVPAILALPYLGSNFQLAYEWRNPGSPNFLVTVDYGGYQRVVTITLRLDSRYATSDGIRVGSQEQALSTFAGNAQIFHYSGFDLIMYEEQGIVFHVSNTSQDPAGAPGVNQIDAITVCVPKKC